MPKLTLTPTVVVPTNTPTAIPPLQEEQARARLLELLANNGGCRLPCLWGIAPGKSMSQEAQTILAPLSSISVSTNLALGGGSIRPWYTEDDLILTTTVGFNVDALSNNQIVSRVGFRAGESKKLSDGFFPMYDSKSFGERLHLYMLPGILSEFGKPASMVIHTYGKQIKGTGGFEIVLIYPEQGMLVHYETEMKTVGTNVRGCIANAQVELELYPAGNADAFIKSLSTTTWAIFVQKEPVTDLRWKAHWKPVEEATSMTLEQFYETFRQPTDKCIETPTKLWPTPESGGG